MHKSAEEARAYARRKYRRERRTIRHTLLRIPRPMYAALKDLAGENSVHALILGFIERGLEAAPFARACRNQMQQRP